MPPNPPRKGAFDYMVFIKGKKHTEITKRKMSESHKGKKVYWVCSGENSPHWIKDRNKLAKRQERNDYTYIDWVKKVKKRDNFKCRINNQDCFGSYVVHRKCRIKHSKN